MQWYEATMNFAAQFQTFLFVKMNDGIVILIVVGGSFFCVGRKVDPSRRCCLSSICALDVCPKEPL